jgi:hypothetical protein
MKKTIKTLMYGALLGAFLAAGNNVNAQPKPAKDAAETAKPKRDWYPFYGTVAAVDAKAKTVSLKKKEGERVLQTDSKTAFEHNGKPATLADVKAGNYLHGKLHKNAANEEIILDAKIELEPPAKKPETNHVAAAAAATTHDAGTNAPAKKKKNTTTQ